MKDDDDGGGAAAAAAPPLTPEQLAATHAPIDGSLMIVAAAGTGKTTTMLERCRYILEQGVPAEQLLVLTFSRKAAAEFQARLRARVPSAAADATVSTFHAWSWVLVRSHWREAGFAQQPLIAASEEQLGSVMRDCIVWDRLAGLASALCGWLFLPPSACWADIAAAAAERYAPLYARCLQAAAAAHSASEAPGAWAAAAPEAAARRSFAELPARLQMLLAFELHDALAQRFGGGGAAAAREHDDLEALLAAADQQAPAYLAFAEGQKRQGVMPSPEAYAQLCVTAAAAGGAGASGGSQDAERQRQLMRVCAAFQGELRRLHLAALGDLPLLARQLLAGGGGAAAAARERWAAVVVDEFQDTGRALLDLLGLLRPRSLTVVGDDDQSIYSFLSALPDCFAEFGCRFGGRTLCLQSNFRSTPAICAFGAALLRANRRASCKAMRAARRGACHPVLVRQHASPAAEAEALAAEAQRLWEQEGVPYSAQAALFRCLRLRGAAPHAALVSALRRRGIPYQVANHERLADDPGVCALISYLALAADPSCDPAFQAVLSLPHHALGQDVQAAVLSQRQAARLAGQPPPSLLQCAEQVCSQAAAAESAAAAGRVASQAAGGPSASQLAVLVDTLHRDDLQELQRLVRLLRGLQRWVGSETLPRAIQRVLHESGLVAWLAQQAQQAAAADAADAALDGCQRQDAAALPPKLQVVVQKAQQLAAEWRAKLAAEPAVDAPGQETVTAGASSADSGQTGGGPTAAGSQAAAAGSQGEEGCQGGQLGEELQLIHELLARLAMESAADALVTGSPATTASQQQQAQQAAAARGAQQAADQQQAGGEQQARGSEDAGAFTISTIHAAKGLEWPVVMLPSLNAGHLPVPWRPPPPWLSAPGGGGGAAAAAAAADPRELRRAHLEEERRLFHVAATRARDRLLVSYVQAPLCPPGAPPGGGAASQATQATQQAALLEQLASAADIPRCSPFLAAAVRHLSDQPGVLRFEGRLPQQELPGLFEAEAEEEEAAQRVAQRQQAASQPQQAQQQQQQQQTRQAGGGQPLASSSQRNAAAGGVGTSQVLSIAERCRLQLAAQGGVVKAGNKAAARRKPLRLPPSG